MLPLVVHSAGKLITMLIILSVGLISSSSIRLFTCLEWSALSAIINILLNNFNDHHTNAHGLTAPRPISRLATYLDGQSVFDSNTEDSSNSATTMTALTTMETPTVNATTNSSSLANVNMLMKPEGVQEFLYYDNMTVDQIDLLVNVTKEYPIQYAKIVFGYLMPIVLLVTFITNSLVIIVLWKPHMRSPTNIVLLMMAIVDLGTLISPSPWYFYIYAVGIKDMYLYPTWKCYAHHIMTDVIPILFHTASIWLALLLASQRYIYVCHPTLALTWCTSPRVTRAIVVIMVTAFLHQLPKFFDNTFIPVAIFHRNKWEMACKNQIADWVQLVNLQGYYTTYFIFRILFVFIVPIIALITLNCLLFQALDRAEDKHKELFGAKYRIVESSGANAPNTNNTCQRSSVDIGTIDNINNQNISNNNGRKASRVKEIYRSLSQVASQSKNKISKQLSKHSTNSTQLKMTLTQPNLTTFHRIDMSNLMEKKHNSKKSKSCSSSSASSASSSSSASSTSSSSSSESCSSSPCRIQSPKELILFRRGLVSPQETPKRKHSIGDGHTSMRGSDMNSNNQSQEESGRDDWRDLNCSERNATYERDQQPLCRRCCQTATSGGATSSRCAVARVTHLSKHMSLCSSVGAYGTTVQQDTTTTAQNISATIYVGNKQGTLGADGTVMNDYDAVGSKLAKIKSLENDNKRNNCSCCNKTHQNNRKCFKCKTQNEVKDAYSEIRWSCERACSSSEPSLSGNQGSQNGKYRDDGISDGGGKGSGANEEKDQHYSQNDGQPRQVSARVVSKRLPASLSDQSQEAKPCNRGRQRKRLSNGATTNTTTTTTTTTTTLYSPLNTTTTDSPGASRVPSIKTKRQLDQQSLLEKSPMSIVGRSAQVAEPSVVKSPPFVSSGTGISTKTNHHKRNNSGRRALRWFSSRGSVAQGSGAATAVHMKYLDSQKTTAMLVVVVSVFLAVEVPVGVMTICHVISNSFDSLREVDFDTPLKYIKLVTNFAIMISYTLNFTIYCSMSKKFRETFRELFNRGRAQSGADQERRIHENHSRRNTSHHQHQFSSSQIDTHQMGASNNNLVSNQSGSESTSGNNLLGSRSVAHLASKVRPSFNRQLATTLTGQQEEECEL